MLCTLRNASVHFPLLRRLLKHFYVARNAHLTIDIIDSSLADGDIAQLIDLKINEADEIEFDNVYYTINDGEEDPFRIPNLDIVFYFQYSNAIDEFKKALSDLAVNACCCYDDSIDESSKNVIQVVSNTTCKMLEKANNQDLEVLLAYTIRNLDSKIATGIDISQYKLMNVKEAPIDNRQEHLDLLCFPTLFPTGQYGEHHSRQSYPAQTLSFSEYIKSRILNKDSRFR
uniref:Uncharacterized protein n=1 Tax=Amphimedon queenslandica TaxID=400682 RepID=A0A1X7VAI5_AMPQE